MLSLRINCERKHIKGQIKTTFMVIGLLFVICWDAFAKKVLGYTPPPYYIRLLISIFTLAPIGFSGAILCYYILRFFDRDNCIRNRKLFFTTACLLVICGSLTGSMDSYNDELWNPAMIGAISLSLIFPVAILILQKRLRIWVSVIISIALLLPSAVIFEIVTYSYQMFGFNIGMPTTW